MSKYYSIEIKLQAECNEDNIRVILEAGTQRGFWYYDEIGETKPGKPPLLNARITAQKIIEAHTIKPEYGPGVHTLMTNNPDENVGLWFYKADDGFLEFHMGAFGSPKKKDMFIDWDYYIRMCLDLCKDFQIMEVRTTMDY